MSYQQPYGEQPYGQQPYGYPPQGPPMWITRGISLVNFAVASSALAFQVFVLYPWHNQLDDEFKALKKEHLRVLDQINKHALSEKLKQTSASQ
ncbi:hypothetical protein BDV18DRAFT_159703 [Aspergillus unguis]